MTELLIFIGGATLFYLTYIGLRYISNEGFFLPSAVKPYYEQIKCRFTNFSKTTQNQLLSSLKEYLKDIYRNRNSLRFAHNIINNQHDSKFVECFINIYLYVNLKKLHYLNEADKLICHKEIKESLKKCKHYLDNKNNFNEELIDWLEYNFNKNDEVYYG